jgi:anaerobic ribonucleoside-triphosphate reductase activating protein
MRLQLARLHYPVTALGPGRRLGIWTQGCTIGCPGCLSRDTWPATVGGRQPVLVSDVLAWCAGPDPATVDGVTISGGEPSEQPAALAALVEGLVPYQQRHGWDVLCYTGVEEDEFARRCPAAYRRLDALVTGPYRAGEPTDLLWRGSANQRLVPLTAAGRERYARWVDARTDHPPLQVQVDDDGIRMIGVPRRGDLGRLERQLAAAGVRLEGASWRPGDTRQTPKPRP